MEFVALNAQIIEEGEIERMLVQRYKCVKRLLALNKSKSETERTLLFRRKCELRFRFQATLHA